MKTVTIDTIMTNIRCRKERSAWNRGVQQYALDILQTILDEGQPVFLFGDDDKLVTKGWTQHCLRESFDGWKGLSRAGEYLIYDQDIAERLCSPSELKRCDNGMRNPNRREDWLDVQGRALYQARNMIIDAIRHQLEIMPYLPF